MRQGVATRSIMRLAVVLVTLLTTNETERLGVSDVSWQYSAAQVSVDGIAVALAGASWARGDDETEAGEATSDVQRLVVSTLEAAWVGSAEIDAATLETVLILAELVV